MDKIIEEFPNYSISKLGVIRNLKTGKIIKPYTNWNGYIRIALMKNGKRYSRAIHRLLAQTYISNPKDFPFINHIDGAKRFGYELKPSKTSSIQVENFQGLLFIALVVKS